MTAASAIKSTPLRLTWKREPSESGLARVCQGPRGRILSLNGKQVGHVSVSYEGMSRRVVGWYWYGSAENVPRRNTCGEPLPTMEEAVADCDAYFRKCLGLKPKGTR